MYFSLRKGVAYWRGGGAIRGITVLLCLLYRYICLYLCYERVEC